MEQAQRLQAIPPYPFGEIARLKERARAEGWDIIDFGIGDPDIPPPDCIKAALVEALSDPVVHQYDETSWGFPEFVNAVGDWFGKRFGVALDLSGGIKVTVGSKEALAKTGWAFLDDGDVCLVPNPAYSVYKYNALFAGAEVHELPLARENGFLPDLDAVPAAVANKAKLLFINYPNNPTGAGATLEFLKRAVDFAEKYDILLCHDAAYSEVYFDGEPAPSVLQVDGASSRAIEFHSLSKTFCVTGWRIGWVCGCREGVAALSRMKSYTDSNVFPAIQRAGAAALAQGDAHTRMVRDVYKRRRDILVDGLRSIGWDVDTPAGTFYVWARVPKGKTSAETASLLLSEARVITIPGSAYGSEGEGFIRFALTMNAPDVEARIGEAVERVARL